LLPGGPEGRKAFVTEAALNQDGEFTKVTFRRREPEAATKKVSQLSVEEREEYLRLFGAALESFSFEPAMEGWFDSDAVRLTLTSGRQSMEIAINEIRGETNLEFRSRLAKLLPIEIRTDSIEKHVQPDPTRRFDRVADGWGLHISLEVGTTRHYKVGPVSDLAGDRGTVRPSTDAAASWSPINQHGHFRHICLDVLVILNIFQSHVCRAGVRFSTPLAPLSILHRTTGSACRLPLGTAAEIAQAVALPSIAGGVMQTLDCSAFQGGQIPSPFRSLGRAVVDND
jgi:hypothetical protein